MRGDELVIRLASERQTVVGGSGRSTLASVRSAVRSQPKGSNGIFLAAAVAGPEMWSIRDEAQISLQADTGPGEATCSDHAPSM
jgi:hypothetical protein